MACLSTVETLTEAPPNHKKPLTRVSEQVPGAHGEKERGWQKGLAKGWRKIGEKLAKSWRRVGEGLAASVRFWNSMRNHPRPA